MDSLFMVVELILAIFLERTTKKDATNSNKPSSQTDKDESALGDAGSRGKGKPEIKTTAQTQWQARETGQIRCALGGSDSGRIGHPFYYSPNSPM